MLSKIWEGFINLMHLMRIVYQKENFKIITCIYYCAGAGKLMFKTLQNTSLQTKGVHATKL
jgi:hypothetical protein